MAVTTWLDILEAGLIAHVPVITPDGPLVLPMAYGRDGDWLKLHGAGANHLHIIGDDHEVCVTVTQLDWLVMARTSFHGSLDYRSVVVRGRARRILAVQRRLYALKLITDHVVAHWDLVRPPSQSGSAQDDSAGASPGRGVGQGRAGDPVDEPDDIAGPWWAGVVPITTRFETPVASADLVGDGQPPAPIAALASLAPVERPQPIQAWAGPAGRP